MSDLVKIIQETEAVQEPLLVSIIIPVYNSEKFFSKTIESILSQTYQNWELIIIDDCSTDLSLDIARFYAKDNSQIKIITHEKNQGISYARNSGLKNALGRYVAFVDSDDFWTFNKLEKQLKFMRENKYYFTYTACELVDEDGVFLHKKLKIQSNVNYKKLLNSNCIVCSSVIIDLQAISVHMPDIHHEDYATWLSILKNNITAFGIEDPLTIYRIRNNSISSNKFVSLSWVFNIYINYLNIPFFLALKQIIIYFFCGVAKYSVALEAVFRKKSI